MTPPCSSFPDVSDIVALALAEDLGVSPERFAPHVVGSPDLLARDVTSASAVGLDAHFSGHIVCREDAVVAGLPVVAAVYDALSSAAGLFDPVEVFPLVAEGARVKAGTPVAEIEGVAAAVLAGERTALDFLMLLSGIATETARWVRMRRARPRRLRHAQDDARACARCRSTQCAWGAARTIARACSTWCS